MSYGQNGYLAISFQNSYGTKLTNSQHFIPIISESVGLNKEQIISESMRGTFDQGAAYEGLNSVDGDIEVEAHPANIGVLLKAVLGDPTTSNVVSFVKQHVYIPSTRDFDKYAAQRPMTIEKYLTDGGSAMQFYDCIGASIEFGVANGELLKAKMSVLGGQFTQVADQAFSFPAHKSWAWDTASVQVAGAAHATFLDATITVDNALGNKHTLGGKKTPQYTKRTGARLVNINGTLLYEDQDDFQNFLSQVEQTLKITFTGGTSIQSGYFDVLTFEFPNFKFTELKPVNPGPGQIEVSFTGQAIYNVNSGTSMKVTLVNTATGY